MSEANDDRACGPNWPALAGILLRALGDKVAERGVPTWVRVHDPPGPPDGDFCLELFEDGRGFLGWTAPPDCQAVGMVATGRAIAEDGPREPPPGFPPGTPTGVRLACLLARDGSIGWQMETAGGVPQPVPPTEGRLLDCLRRCFGLPTPPPPAGPGQLRSLLWLLAIDDLLCSTSRRPTWNQLLDLHPDTDLLTSARLARCAGREPVWSWEVLRRSAMRDNWAWMIVERDVAAWMDEGMFARWMLDSLPSTDDLLARLRPRLAPSAARRLAHAVRAA
jgi:hypothetical protein